MLFFVAIQLIIQIHT